MQLLKLSGNERITSLVTSKTTSKTFSLPLLWVGFSLSFFVITSMLILIVPWQVAPKSRTTYTIYASRPLTIKDINYSVYSRDSRAQRINEIFKSYRCPLEGLGEVFVYEADRNNIPWWLVAAMSFQESSCGKKTPEPQGLESYNAWGWAVYGDNVHSFDNWVRGIETVSAYMANKFYTQGVTNLCDIMKTYTPPSQGSWCKGVQHFGDEIQGFSTEI